MRAPVRTARAGLALGAGLAVALVLALGGCSQISALAPVGGDAIAEVRYGAIDVLLANGIEVLEAPTCALVEDATATAAPTPTTPPPDGGAPSTDAAAQAVTCAGSTVSGDAITVASSTSPDAQLEVEVGGHPVYSGSLQDVIDKAARP